jgi:hypothetical protein
MGGDAYRSAQMLSYTPSIEASRRRCVIDRRKTWASNPS